jgi:hypothetical protein
VACPATDIPLGLVLQQARNNPLRHRAGIHFDVYPLIRHRSQVHGSVRTLAAPAIPCRPRDRSRQ